MNIREGLRIETLQGAAGAITEVEMKSHNSEV